jgi:hypothetical protein
MDAHRSESTVPEAKRRSAFSRFVGQPLRLLILTPASDALALECFILSRGEWGRSSDVS